MNGTNVPQPTLGPAGYIAPTGPAVLAGVQQDYVAAFGSNVNLALETGLGQLASSEAAIITDKDSQFLWDQQQSDPAYAVGRNQDAIGRYYFQTRMPATPTVTTTACVGAVGVVIPAGTPILAEDGNTYAASNTGTIPAGGTLTLAFACTVTGPIACPAQTFDIAQTIGGWDTCISANPGALGRDVETQQAFEQRRGLSVEQNSVNTNDAVLGALLAGNGGQPVEGVTTAYVVDNKSAGTVTIGGVAINPFSLFVSVNSGSDTLAVATTIFNKAPPGTPLQGTTAVTVQDPNPLYNGNGPSYSISFTVAAGLPINAALVLQDTSAVPNNAQALVTAAYESAFAGQDGYPTAASIGGTLFASRFYPALFALGPWCGPTNIESLYIGTGGSPSSLSETATIAQQFTAGTIGLSV
jgi:hypothetical protein